MPAKDWAVRHRQLLRQLGTQRRKLKRLEEEAESLQSKEKLLKTLVAAREEEIKFFARAQNVGDSAADSGDAGWSPPSDVWDIPMPAEWDDRMVHWAFHATHDEAKVLLNQVAQELATAVAAADIQGKGSRHHDRLKQLAAHHLSVIYRIRPLRRVLHVGKASRPNGLKTSVWPEDDEHTEEELTRAARMLQLSDQELQEYKHMEQLMLQITAAPSMRIMQAIADLRAVQGQTDSLKQQGQDTDMPPDGGPGAAPAARAASQEVPAQEVPAQEVPAQEAKPSSLGVRLRSGRHKNTDVATAAAAAGPTSSQAADDSRAVGTAGQGGAGRSKAKPQEQELKLLPVPAQPFEGYGGVHSLRYMEVVEMLCKDLWQVRLTQQSFNNLMLKNVKMEQLLRACTALYPALPLICTLMTLAVEEAEADGRIAKGHAAQDEEGEADGQEHQGEGEEEENEGEEGEEGERETPAPQPPASGQPQKQGQRQTSQQQQQPQKQQAGPVARKKQEVVASVPAPSSTAAAPVAATPVLHRDQAGSTDASTQPRRPSRAASRGRQGSGSVIAVPAGAAQEQEQQQEGGRPNSGELGEAASSVARAPSQGLSQWAHAAPSAQHQHQMLNLATQPQQAQQQQQAATEILRLQQQLQLARLQQQQALQVQRAQLAQQQLQLVQAQQALSLGQLAQAPALAGQLHLKQELRAEQGPPVVRTLMAHMREQQQQQQQHHALQQQQRLWQQQVLGPGARPLDLAQGGPVVFDSAEQELINDLLQPQGWAAPISANGDS